MPEYSGSGFRAHNLYRRLTLAHPEIDVTVLAGSVAENSVSKYAYDGVTVNRIACKPFRHLNANRIIRVAQSALNFRAEFKQTRSFLHNLSPTPDLIHIFGQDYPGAAVLHFASQRNIPALIELCNEMDTPHHYIPFPYSLWLNTPPPEHLFVCISKRLEKVCLRSGVPANRIWCRPNPINEKTFLPVTEKRKSALRKSITKFSDNDKLVVYIAKFIPRKNHEFLLDVVKELPLEYKLFIGGPVAESGPLKTEGEDILRRINEIIAENHLTDRVQVVPGFHENIEQFYQMADVYAFPTKAEGLGTPMLEALACGIPVVANKIEDITDTWVKNGENGFVSTLNPAAFADCVKQAVNIPREQMLKESEKILSAASTSVIDKKYYELMRDLVGNR